ncbi:unnamed protein product [Discosporangium mesarthrocarpum]
MDKYLSLVRLFLCESIKFCLCPEQPRAASLTSNGSSGGRKKRKKLRRYSTGGEAENGQHQVVWDRDTLCAVFHTLEEEVIVASGPIGLRTHLADVWLEELWRVGGEHLPTEAFLDALGPWLRVAVFPKSGDVLFSRALSRVLEGVLEYFPAGKGMGEEAGRTETMEVEREQGEEKKGDKLKFQAVNLAEVQKVIFEAAASEKLRKRARREELYKLHKEYQRRTGIAPCADAPPSGLLSPRHLSEPEPNSDNGEERVGGRRGRWRGKGQAQVDPPGDRRKRQRVLGKKDGPVVEGWVAAGIAAGDIAGGGGEGGGEPISLDQQTSAGSAERNKAAVDAQEERRYTGREKRKSEAGSDVAAAAAAANGEGYGVREDRQGSEVRARSKKHKKKKDKGDVNGVDYLGAEVDAATAVAGKGKGGGVEAEKGRERKEPCMPPTLLEEDGGEAAGEGNTKMENATARSTSPEQPSGETKKMKKKRKKQRVGIEDIGSTTLVAIPPNSPAPSSPSPLATEGKRGRGQGKGKAKLAQETSKGSGPSVATAAAMSVPTPSPSTTTLQTPLLTPSAKGTRAGGAGKGRGGSAATPGTGPESSGKKKVTFGQSMAKDHRASIKDLKTRAITPVKDAETPTKSLLKVPPGLGGAVERVRSKGEGAPATLPRRRRRNKAVDFF